MKINGNQCKECLTALGFGCFLAASFIALLLLVKKFFSTFLDKKNNDDNFQAEQAIFRQNIKNERLTSNFYLYG